MKDTEKTMNPAFPFSELDMETWEPKTEHLGMSKRFYAACAAIQGLLSNQRTYPSPLSNEDFKDLVYDSYKIADQLIKQEHE